MSLNTDLTHSEITRANHNSGRRAVGKKIRGLRDFATIQISESGHQIRAGDRRQSPRLDCQSSPQRKVGLKFTGIDTVEGPVQ